MSYKRKSKQRKDKVSNVLMELHQLQQLDKKQLEKSTGAWNRAMGNGLKIQKINH